MTDSTIFNADKAQDVPKNELPSSTEDTTSAQTGLVEALVGEGKKYKTVEELAKAYANADGFIEQLKAENHNLREQAASAKTIDAVLERLQQQSTPTPVDPQGVSVEDLTKLVEQTVTGLETRKQRETNLLKADAKMREVFGDKAEAKFAEVAVTPELKNVYMQLAASDPDKFVSLFVGGSVPSTSADVGGVNTTASYSATNGVRVNQEGTKEYFDNVRRTNSKLYYSQDFQLKMDRAVRSNPSLYYGKR